MPLREGVAHQGLARRRQPTKHTSEGVVWLAINSGAPGKQGAGAEKSRAGRDQFGLKYPILIDESGAVGKLYGAERTPHLYVIDAKGVLVYRGAIDNSPDGIGESPDGRQARELRRRGGARAARAGNARPSPKRRLTAAASSTGAELSMPLARAVTRTIVYTDGACSGNPGPGGWAWAVEGGAFASGAVPHTTNQRMEITAALEALRALADPLEVVSDSTYVVNCFKQRWHDGWRVERLEKQPEKAGREPRSLGAVHPPRARARRDVPLGEGTRHRPDEPPR